MSVRARKFPWAVLVVVCSFVTNSADAHIKNEASQFPDIEFSESRFDIVVLVGAGIIPETPVFEPDKAFSRKDLATWAALSANLGTGGETPDIEALAQAALNDGLVDSLDGEATYADINRLFFAGQLAIEDAQRTPSKAEAASFIAAQLHTDAGLALLTKRGLSTGNTGEVSSVESRSGHHGSAYFISIGDRTLEMYSHGRVANGPTDLLQWQGRMVSRSFLRGEGESMMWAYLEAQPIVEEVIEEPVIVEEPAAITPPPKQRNLLYGLLVAVVVLGLILFVRRRRH
jgi:hypothetical protein